MSSGKDTALFAFKNCICRFFVDETSKLAELNYKKDFRMISEVDKKCLYGGRHLQARGNVAGKAVYITDV